MIPNWTTTTIGKVAQVLNGGTPKSSIDKYWHGDVLWITPKDMGQLNNDYVVDTNRKITELGLEKSSAKLIQAGSVILSTRAPIGHLAINLKPMATNQGCRGLVPSPDLDAKFLFYFLRMNVELLNDLGSGTTFKELSKSVLLAVEIPLPPINEQKRIVKILDQAFAEIEKARANAGQNLKNARELFESYLQQVFSQRGEGWKTAKLLNIAQVIDSLHKTPKYIDSGYSMVRVTDIRAGELDLSKTKKVDFNTYSEFSKKYKAKIGDIVFSRVGSYGRSSVVTTKDEFCLGQNTVFLVPSINSYFFYYFLNSPNAKEQIEKLVDGTTQPTVSLKSIKSIEVPIPPINDQGRIVKLLDALSIKTNALQEVYQGKLASLDELKKSILQKAFTGQLTQGKAA